MNLKKLGKLAIVIGLATTLAACGASKDSANNKSANTSTEGNKTETASADLSKINVISREAGSRP